MRAVDAADGDCTVTDDQIPHFHESTVKDYVDLPEGARVASLRRPRPKSIQPVQLEIVA